MNHSDLVSVIRGRFPLSFLTSRSILLCFIAARPKLRVLFLAAARPLFRFPMQHVHCFVFQFRCPLFVVGLDPVEVIRVVYQRLLEGPDHFERSVHLFFHASLARSACLPPFDQLREQPSSAFSARITHLCPCEAASFGSF